jgi:ribosomal protein L37E
MGQVCWLDGQPQIRLAAHCDHCGDRAEHVDQDAACCSLRASPRARRLRTKTSRSATTAS